MKYWLAQLPNFSLEPNNSMQVSTRPLRRWARISLKFLANLPLAKLTPTWTQWALEVELVWVLSARTTRTHLVDSLAVLAQLVAAVREASHLPKYRTTPCRSGSWSTRRRNICRLAKGWAWMWTKYRGVTWRASRTRICREKKSG